MALWIVKSVADNPREWKSQKGGDMVSYRIAVETKDGSKQPPNNAASYTRVELVQKKETAAPTVGAELDGDVQTREYESGGEKKTDLKFKKAQRDGRGGGGRAWKPRPDDSPRVFAMRQASIQRQHSQDMALRVLELAGGDGTKAAALMQLLAVPVSVEVEGEKRDLGLVDAFARDASAAGRKAWDYEEKNGEVAQALAELGG